MPEERPRLRGARRLQSWPHGQSSRNTSGTVCENCIIGGGRARLGTWKPQLRQEPTGFWDETCEHACGLRRTQLQRYEYSLVRQGTDTTPKRIRGVTFLPSSNLHVPYPVRNNFNRVQSTGASVLSFGVSVRRHINFLGEPRTVPNLMLEYLGS